MAALIPVLGSSYVATRLVLAGLKSGVRAQTERTMRYALNQVLSHVREIFEGTVRVSEMPGLADRLVLDPESITRLLASKDDELPPGLIEIADATGKIVSRRAIGALSMRDLKVAPDAEALKRALAYERRVNIATAADHLIIRASAPVIDDSYLLRGAVIVSVPLDFDFADRLKAQLSADVVVYQQGLATASSFIRPDGTRELGFDVPESVSKPVLNGETRIVEVSAFSRMFSVGLAPLQNLESERLGMLAVAVDEDSLAAAKVQAWRSLALGGASAVIFALTLAALLSRRLTSPLGHLHAGALAVARGDLDQRIVQETGDEIGDLAVAFAQMTRAVKENQERLAARMREITTLHEIGRAVSSVLGQEELLRKIVDEVAALLSANRCVLLIGGPASADGQASDGGQLGFQVGAICGDVSPENSPARMAGLAEALSKRLGPTLIRLEAAEKDPDVGQLASLAGVTGPLLAVPLEQKDRVLGMLLVSRAQMPGTSSGENSAIPFSDADLRLVSTFADQASAAIANARLYNEVQRSSEDLERKVKERTFELVVANQELELALGELRTAHAALVHSDRMAGLGQLVAGVAHEVNSPAGAIQGAVDTLAENVGRLASRARQLGDLKMGAEDRTRFFTLVEQLAPRLAGARIEPPAQLRHEARNLALSLEKLGVENADSACRTLVEIGAAEAAYQLAQLAQRSTDSSMVGAGAGSGKIVPLEVLVGYLEQYAYLFRNTNAIRTAIRRITRIVGALKGYSHLDQAKVALSDIHEGIENTLVILHSELKYGIVVTRKFGALPPVPTYVDELNQVWTNLIHNAVQALGGEGEILIETRVDGEDLAVSIEDNGPGISPDLMPRIFEPFFTTKAKGEGTGLGLGIVRQIVEKHSGKIDVESRPGCTRFTVRIPMAGPQKTTPEAVPLPAEVVALANK